MGSIEEYPGFSSGSIGYDFEDNQTRAQLELIDDLQKLGVSKYVELPQVRRLNLNMLPLAYRFSARCCRGSEHRQKLCSTSCDRDSILYQRQDVHSICNRDCASEDAPEWPNYRWNLHSTWCGWDPGAQKNFVRMASWRIWPERRPQ